jgi:WD40 repeat protein
VPVTRLELRREDIPPRLLTLAGGGDPAQAPAELAAVLGDGRFLLPHQGGTAWMAHSPDARLLAVPLDEGVALFDANTGDYLRGLNGPGGRVVWVTFSPDSRLLAATTWHEGVGGAVRVWDVAAGRVLYTNPVPGSKVSGAAALSPDGTLLVVEGQERLAVWDARSGREVQSLKLLPGGCANLCFSPDGRQLAVAHYFGRDVRLFGRQGKQLTPLHTLGGHRAVVLAVAYSPNGKFLASGDEGEVKLWDTATLNEVCTVHAPAGQLAFTPDGRTLYAAATNATDRTVHTFARWDLGAREWLPALSVETPGTRTRVHHCLGRDGQVLFVTPGVEACCVRVIDTATGKELHQHRGHDASARALAVSPDGRTLASAGDDWVVKVWDVVTGEVRHSFTGHADVIDGLAFSPDGRLLASSSRDGTVGLWDVSSGRAGHRLQGHSRSPSRVAFSPDGATLAAGGEGGAVKRWDVATGQELAPLQGHTGVVRGVAFSPDGKWLASGGEDHTVRLQDLSSGRLRKFTAPAAVNAVAFSADGRALAAVTDAPAAALRLWDLQTGEEATWQGHTGHVMGLALSPAAPLVATASEDGTVRLWDRTGAPRVHKFGPGPFGGPVRAVAFTPDGRYLTTANANGTVYVLRVAGPPGDGPP